jgi:hypothetical protein
MSVMPSVPGHRGHSGTSRPPWPSTVRKGSTVRVRQRASSDLPATAGFLVFGGLQISTSRPACGRFWGAPGTQAQSSMTFFSSMPSTRRRSRHTRPAVPGCVVVDGGEEDEERQALRHEPVAPPRSRKRWRGRGPGGERDRRVPHACLPTDIRTRLGIGRCLGERGEQRGDRRWVGRLAVGRGVHASRQAGELGGDDSVCMMGAQGQSWQRRYAEPCRNE